VAGNSLTERWRGPLSLVLYPVIFSERPQDEAVAVATMFKHHHSNKLAQIISEIRSEIAYPTQNVRDILNLHAPEKDLREYLSKVADILSAPAQPDS
jgi:hypothetical protein